MADLEERFAGRTEPITADACAEIERVAWPYSRHVLLQYDRDGTGEPDEEDPGWPEPDCTDSVTGTSWEGRGVAPQVDCTADDAIDAALAHMPILKRRAR